MRQADLAGSVTQLATEQRDLQALLKSIQRSRDGNAEALRAIIQPSIKDLDGDLTDLGEHRAEIVRLIGLYDELRRLDALQGALEPTPAPKGRKDNAFAALPPNAYDEFAKAVKALLRAWSFPELDRVVFDTNAEDIVISNKARKDNGKGYRALTYAAFMIGLLQETARKNLPHPGFIVLDSPLVTYREPQEHMGEGVKAAFYRNLAATVAPAEVIILENVGPPDELKPTIAYTAFTKNLDIGRYGLFPPVTLVKQE